MTEAELMAVQQRFIENSLFGVEAPVTERTPDWDIPVEDVFTGLRGGWTVHFDEEWVDAQPDGFNTVLRARLRYVELDGPEYDKPLRFTLSQIDAITLSILQDLADEFLEERE